jgi:hypothetical protein
MSAPNTPNVRVWDGTNYAPTADAAARASYTKLTDGTNTAPTMDAVGRAGYQQITDGANVLGTPAHPVRTDPTGSTTQPVSAPKSATSTITGVAASVTSTILLASNTSRLGATIHNDSTSATLYIKLGTTASNASGGYTTALTPGSYYEVPFNYTGRIDGIWSSATGFANIDELTA